MKLIPALLAVAVCLAPAGCKKAPPPIVVVSGVATLNGKPLDHAAIQLWPIVDGLDGDFMATAVTDEAGKFTFTTGAQAGTAACTHKVVVMEGPMPKGTRGESEKAQIAAAEHLKSLKNRPIPAAYTVLADTPLTVTITGPDSNLMIDLKN